MLRISLPLLIFALALLTSAPLHGQTLTDPNLQVQTIVSTGLSQPTGLRFLGASPSDFFVIEKATGQVKRFLNGTSSMVLDLPVNSSSERGLLGIALHPNFDLTGQDAARNKVYLYYSRGTEATDDGSWVENRLSRFNWNGTSLSGESSLATFGTSSDGQAQGPNHDGGPITFGPDGKLYGITGDLNRSASEQNQGTQASLSTSLVGGIYRLNPDGTIPGDNPFSTTQTNPAFQRMYAYGIRNSFGLAFDTNPTTPTLWQTENGPDVYDEVNRVAPGFNSGWSDLMGPDSRDPQGVANLINLGASSTYSDPEFSWETPIAVTAIHFLHGSNLGAAYDNRVFVGDANNGNLYSFTLNAARDGFVLTGDVADLVADSDVGQTERNSVRIGQSFGAVTDLVRGPDGNIYVTNISQSRVYRISPKLIQGDFSLDGLLTNADVQAMLNALKDLTAYMTTNNLNANQLVQLGDFTGDAAVNAADIQPFLTQLTQGGAGSTAPVPEPASAVLIVIGALAIGGCALRRRSAA